MIETIRVSDRLSIGGQPSEGDLDQLAERGFRAVVNLRMDDEANLPISPEAERAYAESAGLSYRRLPIRAPAVVAIRLAALLGGGYADATLIEHAGASLFRVLAALAAAFLVAVPVGIGMASSPMLRGIFDPIIEAYRPIPPLAHLPLVIIWFGIGETAKVLLIFLAIVPAIALSTASGVRGVPA
jgi:ABC-type anion transport system duplicated permease subunit